MEVIRYGPSCGECIMGWVRVGPGTQGPVRVLLEFARDVVRVLGMLRSIFLVGG